MLPHIGSRAALRLSVCELYSRKSFVSRAYGPATPIRFPLVFFAAQRGNTLLLKLTATSKHMMPHLRCNSACKTSSGYVANLQ